MAKNTQPIAKRCRALGISPAVMGYGKKTTNRNPGGQMRKKKSEYATQLNEKQKVKFVYGILENQFHTYYEKASRMPGQTGVNLLVLVERRLDNVASRLGFAGATASFELKLAQIRDLSKAVPMELIAYGRLPLMITENCIVYNHAGQHSNRQIHPLFFKKFQS